MICKSENADFRHFRQLSKYFQIVVTDAENARQLALAAVSAASAAASGTGDCAGSGVAPGR